MTHTKNPWQIATAIFCGKFPRKIPAENSYGKFLRQILAANSHGKFTRQIPTLNTPIYNAENGAEYPLCGRASHVKIKKRSRTAKVY